MFSILAFVVWGLDKKITINDIMILTTSSP